MKKSALLIKCCENCIKGISVGIQNEILCREKGILRHVFCPKRRRQPEKSMFKVQEKAWEEVQVLIKNGSKTAVFFNNV